MKNAPCLLMAIVVSLWACKTKVRPVPSKPAQLQAAATEPIPDSLLITILDFPITQHNFGRVKEGTILKTKYKFYNRGKYPLKIRRVEGACSCTTFEYPEVVEPGDSAYFTLRFDTKDKDGPQIKYLSIIANTEPSATEIMYTADVK